jgi:anaerobic selenocysteine-containing dehydrogenase
MNARKAAEMGIKDFDWIWVESHNGKIRCQDR